jgi:hypothetical protein
MFQGLPHGLVVDPARSDRTIWKASGRKTVSEGHESRLADWAAAVRRQLNTHPGADAGQAFVIDIAEEVGENPDGAGVQPGGALSVGSRFPNAAETALD